MIDIVVSTKGNLEMTRESIQSLIENTGNFRLIAIDNNSNDIRCNSYLQTIADVVIRHNEDVSLAEAWNRGIGCGTNDIVVVTCNDILYSPGWLDRLAPWFETESNAGCIQPFSTLSAKPTDFPDNYKPLEFVGPIVHSQFIGSCFAFARNTFELIERAQFELVGERVGGFDKRYYPLGIEDHDFCMMARRLGLRNLTAYNSYIHHYTGKTVTALYSAGEREKQKDACVSLFRSKHGVGDAEKIHVSKLWRAVNIRGSERLVAVRFSDRPDGTDVVYLLLPNNMRLEDEKALYQDWLDVGYRVSGIYQSFDKWLIARGAREALDGDIETIGI
jgi:hypothetical protein